VVGKKGGSYGLLLSAGESSGRKERGEAGRRLYNPMWRLHEPVADKGEESKGRLPSFLRPGSKKRWGTGRTIPYTPSRGVERERKGRVAVCLAFIPLKVTDPIVRKTENDENRERKKKAIRFFLTM